MYLFIFEPDEWSYCGGAIGVVADNFSDAVDLIVATNEDDEDYEVGHFHETKPESYGARRDDWLLTHKIKLHKWSGMPVRGVLFDNWTYS